MLNNKWLKMQVSTQIDNHNLKHEKYFLQSLKKLKLCYTKLVSKTVH